MTAGMKQHLLSETQKKSASSEMVMAAFTGATLGVLNWWIENNMTLNAEEVYNEIKQVFHWEHLEKIQEGFAGKE